MYDFHFKTIEVRKPHNVQSFKELWKLLPTSNAVFSSLSGPNLPFFVDF